MEESRAATLTLGLSLAGGGAATAFLAGASLTALLRGARLAEPRVTVSFGDAFALPAGVAMALLGAMLLIRMAGRDAARPLFASAVAALGFVLVLPPALLFWAETTLPDRGYRKCDDIVVSSRYGARVWFRGDPALCRQPVAP